MSDEPEVRWDRLSAPALRDVADAVADPRLWDAPI